MELNILKFKDYSDAYKFYSMVILTLTCVLLYKWIAKLYAWIQLQRKLPPGPIGLPFFGYLPFLGTSPHKALWQMRKKYGDVIGLYIGRSYTVILNNYELTRDVLNHPSVLSRSPKVFETTSELGFLFTDKAEWVEQRRFAMFVARDLGVGKGLWEEILSSEVERLVGDIRELQGRPLDISHSLHTSIAISLLSLLLGRSLERGDKNLQIALEYPDASMRYTGPTNWATQVPVLKTLLKALRVGPPYAENEKVIKAFQDFTKREILLHKTVPDAQNMDDFINTYLKKIEDMAKTTNTKHYFTEENLAGSLNVLFLGSMDTVATSMVWSLRLMAKHRDVQRRVREELRTSLGADGRPRYSQRHNFPYTFAVLLEVQRFASVVPISTTRRVTEDIEVSGYSIPKGSDIASNLWGLHHDPSYWDRPEVFMPERFLSEDGKINKNQPSFAPFSLGRRNCPGETIAWMGIVAYFAEIIRHFEVSTEPGLEPDFTEVLAIVMGLRPQSLLFKPIANLEKVV